MDLYASQSDLQNGVNQMHGYDPGITPTPGLTLPGGVFWVVPIHEEDVVVNLSSGKATMDVSDLAVKDWMSNGNSISGGKLSGPGVPATVSFTIRWKDVLRTVMVHNATERFAGEFKETGATMTWSAQQNSQVGSTHGFRFVSDPANTTKTSFAEIGHEMNGVFFPDFFPSPGG
jgi:hypothetical protein